MSLPQSLTAGVYSLVRGGGVLMRVSVAIAVACLGLVGLSVADESQAAIRKQTNIPAQGLGPALQSLAKEREFQIVYVSEEISDRHTQGASGELTIGEALTRLLNGTGLTYRYLDENTVTVLALSSTSSAGTPSSAFDSATHALSTPQAFNNPDTRDSGTAKKAGFWDRFRLAQNDQSSSSRTSDSDEQEENPSQSSDKSSEGRVIDEVVVTGSHIRGVVPAGSKLITLDKQDIAKTGYATVQDVVRTLPANFGGGPAETTRVVGNFVAGASGTNFNYGSSFNLRGLGPGATLTLLNGRRLAPGGLGSFVDVSAVPLSMIERIEIVPDGASATYGSDAVGGVVNMILRRDRGAQTRMRYGALTAGDAPEKQFSQTFGPAWSTGEIFVGYQYYSRDSLAASDRNFTADSDLRPLGGSNFSSPQSNPGNITRIGATPATLAVPSGQNGTSLSESQLISGQVNFQNLRESTDLLPEQEQHSAVFSGSQSLGQRWKLFADGIYSERDFRIRDDRIGTPLTIPETNAYRVLNNLFPGRGNISMDYNFTDDLGPLLNFGQSSAYSATLGTSVSVGKSWFAEISGTYATLSEDSFLSNRLDTSQLQAVLASNSLSNAFNPFADGSNSSPAVIASLTGSSATRSDTDVRSVNFKADGAFLTFPAGDAKLGLGAESREEKFGLSAFDISSLGVSTDASGGTRAADRTVRAVFAEANLPIFSEMNERPVLRLLDVSFSARYEDYSDAGSTFNPRIGARWSPVGGLILRGSYGTSFRAPLLSDLGKSSNARVLSFPPAIDPLATGGSTVTLALAGGNPNLEPETADTWTLGVQFVPPSLEAFQLDLNYFDAALTDRVGAAGNVIQVFAQPALFPGVLIRNPSQAQVDAALASADTFVGVPPAPGSVEAILDLRLANLASVRVNGIDLSASYGANALGGAFDFSLNASYLLGFDEQFTSTSPVSHNVSTIGKPVDLKVRTGASWSRDSLSTSLFVNYADSYRDNLSVPARKIDSWTTLDFQLRYDFAGTWLGDTTLSLSVINLLDQDPPFANISPGYGFDPTNASPLGRFIAIEVGRKW